MESRRVPLSQDAIERSASGAHARDAEAREWRARRHSRSRGGRLRDCVVATSRRSAPEDGSLAVVLRSAGVACRAFRHALAHAADHRRCPGSSDVGPDPESQRAQQARRRVLGQAVQVRGHLVGDAPWHEDLELGSQARRDDGRDASLHRLCREARVPWSAGRGLEQGMGRRLVRARRGVQLHGAVSRLRPARARGLREIQRRPADRSPRNGRQCCPL